MNRILFYIITVFLLAGPDAGAEQASVPRKLAIFLVFSGNVTEPEKAILAETLLSKISGVDSITVVEPMWKGTKDITYAEKNEKARAIGADCYLTITISGEKERIFLKFLSFDILQNKIAVEEKTVEKERELRSLDRTFWQSIVMEIASNFSMISGDLVIKEITRHTGKEKVIEETRGIKVVIVAQPGTSIEGLGSQRYTTDDDGIATLELPQSSTFELYATCPGFYPVRKEIFVGSEPVRVELDQNQASMFAVDLYLQQVDYLGAGFRYYYIANKFFLDLKTTLFFWKLIWPVSGDKSKYEAPLVHLSLLTGLYLNNEDDIIRFSISSGAFLRIVYIDPVGIMLSPICRYGISLLSLNTEISTFERLRFYLEYNVNIYLTENVDFFRMLVSGGGNSSTAPGYIFIGNVVWDLLDFKIGVRYQL